MDIPCIWTRSIIFRWQPLSTYVSPPSENPGNQHSWPHHSSHPLYFQLTFASVQAEPLMSHILGSSTSASSIMSVHQRASLTLQFLSFLRESMECDGNRDNGDKVPLRDDKGATSRNCI